VVKLYYLFHFAWILYNIMENKKKFQPDRSLKLMDQVRQVLRYHNYAYRTEQTCCKRVLDIGVMEKEISLVQSPLDVPGI